MWKIPNFRGVFMRDTLPPLPRKRECAIVNLQGEHEGIGTHWVAFRKDENTVNYFDSYGDLKPPKELIKYF